MRFGFVLLLMVGVAPGVLLAADQSPRPNVILVVADDLGYGDLGIQGGKDIPTPHIDSLARNGGRFQNGYVSCPVCSPTRAGLVSGRYQQRFGHEFNPGPQAAANFGLPLTEHTIADAVKSGGYKTGLVGKWHLGNRPEYLPQRRGFDEFYGFLGGAHPYLPPGAQPAGGDAVDASADASAAPVPAADATTPRQARRAAQQPPQGRQPIFRGTEVVPDPEYLTDAFGHEAVSFIERHRDDPYFLYLAFNGVHNPQQATQKYLDRFPNLTGGRKIYAAKLSAVDDAVGEVLTAVRKAGQEENTLIVFISDNGGPQANYSTNTPLAGQKGTVWEGGIRVPFFVQWKGKVPAGVVREQPVISLDLFPTILAAAGVPVPEGKQLDGVNLLPLLTGPSDAAPKELAERALYWRFGPQWAVRQGDWKLLSSRDGQVSLFNLKKDVGEKNDLSAAQPDKAGELRAAWAKWDAQLAKPLWDRQEQARAANRNRAAQPAGTAVN